MLLMHTEKTQSDLRVFVGPGNTAGNATWIADALRRAGFHARSYAYRAHVFGYEVDHQIRQFRPVGRKGLIKLVNNRFVLRPLNALMRLVFFCSVLFRYDLFYFISPVTFFHRHHDLPLLRLFGKKIAFFFPGCAEKDPYDLLNRKKHSDCWYCNDEKKQQYCLCHQLHRKRARIQKFEKHASYIFSRPNTSGFLRHPDKAFPMWLMTDPPSNPVSLKKFDDTDVFRIVHFPSHKELKGTRYVDAAVRNLRIGGMELEYITGPMSNREVLEQLEKAHIVVDQFTHTFGLLAVEAMSRGCVVICRMEKWARDVWPDVPLVSCNPEDLEQTLKELLENPEIMKEIAEKSVAWHRRYAIPDVVGKFLTGVFQEGMQPEDFAYHQTGKTGNNEE